MRGTVAYPTDLDFILVLNHNPDNIAECRTWISELSACLTARHAFLTDLDVLIGTLTKVEEDNYFQVMIKTQSVCMYGDNLANSMPPHRIDQSLAVHAVRLEQDVAKYRDLIINTDDVGLIRKKAGSIMKRIIRTGFELVIEDSGCYTRDLYPCYKNFSKYIRPIERK